jgi:hypothetical protein
MLRISYDPFSGCVVIQDVYTIIFYFIIVFELINCVRGLHALHKETLNLSQVVLFKIVVQ